MPFTFDSKPAEAVYNYLVENGQSTAKQLHSGLPQFTQAEVEAAIAADVAAGTIELHGTTYSADAAP